MNPEALRTALSQLVTQDAFGSTTTVADIMVSLTVALLCATVIHLTYRHTYQGVLYQRSFNAALVMTALITTIVIATISGNLILSLGMVGALSIVRFRTAVKDPLDIVFMFWAIAVGIVCGVQSFLVGVGGSLFLAATMLVLNRVRVGRAPFILIVKYVTPAEEEVFRALRTYAPKHKLKSKTLRSDQVELTVELRLKDKGHDLVNAIGALEPVRDVALLAYSNEIIQV